MVQSRTSSPLKIPAPIRGMVDEAEMFSAEEGYARFLRNFITKKTHCRERPAQRFKEDPATVTGEALLWSSVSQDDYLWSDGAMRGITGTVLLAAAGLDAGPIAEVEFKDQLFLWNAGTSFNDACYQRNGTSWSLANYTFANLSNTTIGGCCAYRGRMYFHGDDSGVATIEYGGLGAITGATTAYTSVDAFLEGNERIYRCMSVVVELGIDTEEVFVVYGSFGSVLVFQGNDPSSWTLVGSWKMISPATGCPLIEVEGDVLVCTREYIYSTRELFSSGSRAAISNSITKNIRDFYKFFINQSNSSYVVLDGCMPRPQAVYVPWLEAYIISCGFAADVMSSDEAEFTITGPGNWRRAQLVYFRETEAWALWDLPSMNGLPRLDSVVSLQWVNGNVVYQIQKETDEFLGYDFVAEASEMGFGSDLAAGTLGNGDKYDFINYEPTWETEFLALENAKVDMIQPIFRQYGKASTNFSEIACAGLAADGTTAVGDDVKKFQRVEDAPFAQCMDYSDTQNSLSSVYPIQKPQLTVGLEGWYLSAYLRFRNMEDEANATESTRQTEIWGMNIQLQKQGVF